LQKELAGQHAVSAIGPFWSIDGLRPTAPIEAYSFDEREPRFFERWFLQAHDPIRSVRPDPWRTWELRAAHGQTPNPPPLAAPRTRDERRIAHNLALVSGDRSRAATLRADLERDYESAARTRFSDGTELLGARFEPGVAPRLRLLFAVGTPPTGERQFDVRSVMFGDERWSFITADDKEKQVGTFFALAPMLWKAGELHEYVCEIRHRPGKERFYGFFVGAGAPRPEPSTHVTNDRVLLLELP
jgi:hypothetical protein